MSTRLVPSRVLVSMNVVSQLLSHDRPEAPALIAGEVELTHTELRQRANRAAAFLLSHGARKGDRIGIWAENGVFFVIAYLGIMRAGLVAVPLPMEGSPESLHGILGDAGIRRLLVSPRHQTRLKSWLKAPDVEVFRNEDLLGGQDLDESAFPRIEPARDLAALMFTSGSTGKPKGVQVTHQNIACNTRDIVAYLALNAHDRALVVLPFYYCFGLSVLHSHLAVGASVVINNQFLYPEKVLQEMLARECTGLAGVPSTFQILLRKSRFKEFKFPKLRWLQQAGGKLPNAYIQELRDAFPNVRVYVMYGQTEATARLSYLPPERLADKLGSVGRGLPSCRVEVLRADGTPVRPGSEEIGEIVASGDNVTLGYWNDPQETERYFRNGRLHTGDLARVDADGFVYIVERERELIKCGGNRVSAKEIEDVIAEIPGVVEVAVVAVPHEILGEAPLAFIVLAPRASDSAASIQEHCRVRLPSFKVPLVTVPLPQLPHNGSGKVMKSELKELAKIHVPAT